MTDEPVKMKEFEIPKEFQDHINSLRLDRGVADTIRGLCRRVEELVVKLGISDQCTGFVTDGDLAISWEKYWTEERRAAKSVSCSHIICGVVLDAPHRVHLSSCPGHSSMPTTATCIRLWMTWNRSSGSQSGAHSSTRITIKHIQIKRRL